MIEFNLTEGIGMGCGCDCGERGAGGRRKGGSDGGGMRKAGERDDELADFFSSFRYQGGGGLRAKIFPPRVSDDLKAVAAAARAASRNPRATPPPPTSRQDRSQILPPPPTRDRDRDRGQIHQTISQINKMEKEESPPAPVIFFTRDGPRLAPVSFFIRKGPRRRVVMINGERRVMTEYFSLPPGAVVIEEDEEELEKPPSSKVTRSSLKNKRKKIEEVEKEEKAASEEKKPRTTLTAAESRAYYYKRVPHDNKWQPPTSHHKLIQESHYSDPWRVLVICILLNKTTGTQVKKMLDKFFSLCPNAEAATKVSEEELMETLWPLGLYNMRTEKIKRFSREYLGSEWTHVTQLYGIGKYAADAYAMFCMGAVEEVNPHDHKLVKYWQFLCEWRAQERRRQVAEGGVFF